ncbi:PA3496 family putative envelope integrity protein [Legionella clemsonensis]|uniref:Uncharacterized protein n=1 Tax=Legionella clemsonensis TaxID=1867846 RepID=A0A222P4J4_9GAMM|nr:hypothetical protein [Legionella clemsonensis]ASQ46759.1 hypothetical protein clem_11065 [Legionella clemsonensis]
MSLDDFDTDVEDTIDSQEIIESGISTKLERRRRIEELSEEKRLRQELNEFDFIGY